jgi:hypothetical protein
MINDPMDRRQPRIATFPHDGKNFSTALLVPKCSSRIATPTLTTNIPVVTEISANPERARNKVFLVVRFTAWNRRQALQTNATGIAAKTQIASKSKDIIVIEPTHLCVPPKTPIRRTPSRSRALPNLGEWLAHSLFPDER